MNSFIDSDTIQQSLVNYETENKCLLNSLQSAATAAVIIEEAAEIFPSADGANKSHRKEPTIPYINKIDKVLVIVVSS